MYTKKVIFVMVMFLIITAQAFATVKTQQVTFSKESTGWQCHFLAHRGDYWEFADKHNETLTGDDFDTFKSLDGFGAAFLGSLESTLQSEGYIGPGDTLIWSNGRLYVVLDSTTCMSLAMLKTVELTSITFTWDIGSLWRCKIEGMIIITVGDEHDEYPIGPISVWLKKSAFNDFVAPFINILKGNIKSVLVLRGYMPAGEAIGWE